MSLPQPLRGAIVRHGSFLGVVLEADDGGAVVAEVVWPDKRGGYRHRADVAHNEFILPTDTVIRAGVPKLIRSRLTATGRVSDALVERITAAMKREVKTRRFEDSHTVTIEPPSGACVRF